MAFNSILLAAGLTGLAALWLLWRQFVPPPAPSAPFMSSMAGMLPRALGALWAGLQGLWAQARPGSAARARHLEAQAWLLLLGEQRSGKSSLLASVRRVRTDQHGYLDDPPGLVPGADALSLPQGVLWDADGSAWGTGHAALMRVLCGLRTQRPLDAVVLVLSVATLLDGDANTRRAVALAAAAQLLAVRHATGLQLPVYVVLTKADALEGFGAFWQCAADPLTQHMVGWSAPGELPLERLVDAAMDGLGEALARLRLRAASGHDVPDGLGLALFPQALQALREPLAEALRLALPEQAWQPGFACRGIYLLGAAPKAAGQHPESPAKDGPRNDLLFAEGLVTRRLLAERGLARQVTLAGWPAWRHRFGLPALLATLGLALAAGMAWAAHALAQRVASLQQLAQTLPVTAALPCPDASTTADALKRVAALDGGWRSGFMPWSLLAPPPDGDLVQQVQHRVLAPIVLPALACRLRERLAQPLAALPAGLEPAQRRHALLAQGERALQLDSQLADYQALFSADTAQQRQQALQRLTHGLMGMSSSQSSPSLLLGRALGAARPDASLPVRLPEAAVVALAGLPAALRSQLAADVASGTSKVAAVQELAARRAASGNSDPAPRAQVQALADWLTWVDADWHALKPERNPCQQAADQLGQGFARLRLEPAQQARLGQALEALRSETNCFTPLAKSLRAMKLGSPTTPLLGPDGQLTPTWRTEATGLRGLLALRYTQADGEQSLVCVKDTTTWQAAAITVAWGHAREYQRFAVAQGLAPQLSSTAERPLFDGAALALLERSMNGALRAAQQGAAAVAAGLPVAVDDGMPLRSAEFQSALGPLLPVQQLYGQLRLTTSATNLVACSRDHAIKALGQIKAMAVTSQLYTPGPGSGGALLALGPAEVARDYLARQLGRSATLVGYAQPYLSLLANTQAVNEAQEAADQTLPYWANTAAELQRYVQGKDASGQVGQTEALVLNSLSGLTRGNCASRMGAAKTLGTVASAQNAAPTTIAAAATVMPFTAIHAVGSDLFAERRAALITQARQSCTATAYAAYQELAARFNSTLAGRYPFGNLSAADASLAQVKRFMLDYAEQASTLRSGLTASTDAGAKPALAFLQSLDKVAAFLGSNLAAGEASQALTLTPSFRLNPQGSPGSEHVVNWALTVGERVVTYPSVGPTSLPWPFGQALVLDITWADGSVGGGPAAVWQPSAALGQRYTLRGATASFLFGGDWALLRFIETQRSATPPPPDALDPGRVVLQFNVPTQRTASGAKQPTSSSAQLYVGLRLSAIDPKTQASTPVIWPGPFPSSAP